MLPAIFLFDFLFDTASKHTPLSGWAKRRTGADAQRGSRLRVSARMANLYRQTASKPDMRTLLLLQSLLLLVVSPAASAFLDQFRDDDIPPPEQAMQVNASPDLENQHIRVEFLMAPDVYLYQHNLRFQLFDLNGNLIDDFADLALPAGIAKNDPIFGDVEVYYDTLSLTLPLESIPLTETALEIRYQGCLEDILCYPPQEASLPLVFVSADALMLNIPADEPQSGFLGTLRSQDANAFSNWLTSQNLALVSLLFFTGGLLLAFTPCVFPMVPILSGIIAGQKHPTARRGFLLSSAYVAGMAVPYTLAGVLVAIFGASLNLQFWLQQPAAILVSASIFVLLSLAMFGVFNLQLPAFLRDRVSGAAHGHGGSLGGAALMGLISALVVSPCVTPILAGALIYVASTGDAATGALSLLALSLGMGAPLIAWGTGGSHLLPRAGAWMDHIKQLFGVLMLGVAIWLLDRLLADGITLALYGLLLAIYGVKLGALEAPSSEVSRLRRMTAMVLALYGAVMVVGAGSGGSDPLNPFAQQQASSERRSVETGISQRDGDPFITAVGLDAVQQLLDDARHDGQPVLLDFSAEWCVVCKALEANTLNAPAVQAAMAEHDFKLVRADVTRITRENQALMSRYTVFGLPTLIFLAADGSEVAESRVLGDMDAERFLNHLNMRVFPSI